MSLTEVQAIGEENEGTTRQDKGMKKRDMIVNLCNCPTLPLFVSNSHFLSVAEGYTDASFTKCSNSFFPQALKSVTLLEADELPLQLIMILSFVCKDIILNAFLSICGSTDAGQLQGAQLLCITDITDESWSL